jgi:3-methyladenine DNA glycosylase AlkC
MDQKILLKDQLFNKEAVEKIATRIHKVYSEFDQKSFTKNVLEKFPQLELTPRITWISKNLNIYLPTDYKKAVSILLKSLPSHQDSDNLDTDFGDFMYAPYSDFVAKYGCTEKDMQFSLEALHEMTKRFSAEDAIRYFITTFPKETFLELMKWSIDTDYHVRRLTSEGTRPLLPWSKRIPTPVTYAIPLLDNLFFDKSRFVTRSVANHINDISKIEPSLVFTILKRWQQSEKQDPKEMTYIINQGLRTLIKKGNAEAIRFLNFSTNPKVIVSHFTLVNKTVKIGERVAFTAFLTAQKDERLLIDYSIDFQNKAGNGHNTKVFKLKIVALKKGQSITIHKAHRMYHFSTRKLNPGKHILTLQINGSKVIKETFELVK